MFLLIDNYDSFTYNLVQYFQCLGEDPLVLKNDDPKILDLAKSGTLDKVVLSPGPSVPEKPASAWIFSNCFPRPFPFSAYASVMKSSGSSPVPLSRLAPSSCTA